MADSKRPGRSDDEFDDEEVLDESAETDDADVADEDLDEDDDEANEDEDEDDLDGDAAPAATKRRAAARTAKAPAKARAGAGARSRDRAESGPRIVARFVNFIREVVAELQKVIWPTRKELLTYTTVVVVFVTVVMTVVGLLDVGFAKLMFLVFGSKTSS